MGADAYTQMMNVFALRKAPQQGQQNPMFTQEGPDLYQQAYLHNAPFATGGSYNTPLSPSEEASFRQWIEKNNVPFDPNAATQDYDMRGYWKSSHGQPDWKGQGAHFPDTYKTPYDTTFSAESQYAKPGTPYKWHGNDLIDESTGQVIYRGGQ